MKWKKLKVRDESPEATRIPLSVYVKSPRARAIEDYILWGNPRGKEAIKDLFPIRNCSCPLCV